MPGRILNRGNYRPFGPSQRRVAWRLRSRKKLQRDWAEPILGRITIRRDAPRRSAEVELLAEQLEAGGSVFTTRLVLQESLQGFAGPNARNLILQRFAALPFLVPDRGDYVKAAALRNTCRRKGVQIRTIDALLSQLCIHHIQVMLTTDRDVARVARHSPLKVWKF